MKNSKIRRKRRNELTANSADPHREPRKYRIPPTFGRAATKTFHVGTCERKIGDATVKQGRFIKRKQTVAVPCGGRLIARLGKGTRRRVYCENCRARRNERRRLERLEKRMTRLHGALTPKQQERESRAKTLLGKFGRKGSR